MTGINSICEMTSDQLFHLMLMISLFTIFLIVATKPRVLLSPAQDDVMTESNLRISEDILNPDQDEQAQQNTSRSDMVKAAAMIIAEIERIDRKARQTF